MILTLDVGNSRVKWIYWRSGEPVDSDAAEYLKDAVEPALASLADFERPERILVASVAGNAVTTALDAWAGHTWGIEPEYLSVGRHECGVTHGYDDPGQHGADRWAALLGARALTQAPVCLIDAGTAVTIDWMDADGHHQGGLILPGLKMMREALVQSTDGIMAYSLDSDIEGPEMAPVARSTEAAVHDGTLLMLTSALAENIRGARQHLGDDVVIMIAGGMAPLVQALPGLPPLRQESDLVHRGLLQAFHATGQEH